MSDAVLDAAVARAIARLSEPESPHLARGIEIAIEAALSRPLRDVIDPDRIVAITVASVDAERLERSITTMVRPAIDRQVAALAERADTLADWLPPDAPALLDDLAKRTRPPRGAWAKAIVDPADVRELLSPVLQETLLAFARKIPMVGSAEESRAGKLLGGLARGIAQGAGAQAQKIADVGGKLLGGLGAEMDKRIHQAAKDFSQSAFDPLKEAFVQRLASDEGQAILARMRTHAIEVLLAAKASSLIDDLDSAPRAELDRLIARTIAHDAARPEVQSLLRAEVETFLAQRDGKTIGDLLDELGVKDLAITEARHALSIVIRAAAADTALASWLRDLLVE